MTDKPDRPTPNGDGMMETDAAFAALYDKIVHGLRMHGWSRMDAEGEALNCLDRLRHNDR